MPRSLLAATGTVAASLFCASVANAAPPPANEMLPGCRFFIEEALERRPFSQGNCAGTIHALMVLGDTQDESIRFCVPDGVTVKQAVQVAVTYIDRIPHRMHEPFLWLSVEAFRAAWPCKSK